MDNLEFKKMLKTAIKRTDRMYVSYCVDRLLEELNPFHICDFAELVPLADDPELMPKLANGMYNCNDIYHLYEFLFCMNDSGKKFVPFDDIATIIKDSGIAKIIYYCIECIDWCNTEDMEQALLGTDDYRYILAYSENKDLKKFHSEDYIENLLKELLSDRYEICGLASCQPQYYWDKYFENLDLDKKGARLEPIIEISKRLNNPMLINMGAEYEDFLVSQMPDAFRAMMDSENELHIYEYYCSMKEHPNPERCLTKQQKKEILAFIENCNNAKIMYYVCAWTDASLELCLRMREAIYKTGNKKYIDKVEIYLQETFGDYLQLNK